MWTGDADGTNWTNPGNWSSDAVPGSTDVVTINVPGNVTIQIASGAQTVLSLTSSDALSITGGSLTVTAGTSQENGALTVGTGGTLSASGAGTTFTASGAGTINGSIFASGGAVVAFPNVTSLAVPTNSGQTIQASGTSGPNGTGTPSEIDLSHVTTLSGTSNNVITFNASTGGKVDLSHLATNPTGRNFFEVSGSGSVLDLSSLPASSPTRATTPYSA